MDRVQRGGPCTRGPCFVYVPNKMYFLAGLCLQIFKTPELLPIYHFCCVHYNFVTDRIQKPSIRLKQEISARRFRFTLITTLDILCHGVHQIWDFFEI